MRGSRTTKSIKNANIALIFYFIGIILNFVSRKVFIDKLGADILGLNTIAVNLLSFLNLAELGVSSAVSYALYQPILNNDKEQIVEILTLQGYFYRKIAFVTVFLASILLLFFPLIFSKSNLPLWYAYSTFSVLLISVLMGYMWNYKQILLTADQKQYKITVNQQSINYLKIILQIVSIVLFSSIGYILWLIWEFLFAILKTVSLSYLITKEYKWLHIKIKNGRNVLKKHNDILIKTKQLFFHKIGGFVLTQTSPLILYFVSSLALVAAYGNYVLITTGLLALLNAIFNSISAGIGNLVAQRNNEVVINVFWELFFVRFIIVSLCSVVLYYSTDPFITFWVGHEYLLEKKTLLLIILIFYVNSLRSVVDSFIQAYGLFNDIWATILEATLNLSLSLLLGYFYGIDGILCGVFISLFLMVHLWKPIFLFKYGFKLKVKSYFCNYFYCVCVFFLVGLFNWFFIDCNFKDMQLSYLIYKCIIIVFLDFLVFILLFIMMFKNMRHFFCRIFKILYSKS